MKTARQLAEKMYLVDRTSALAASSDIRGTKLFWGRTLGDASRVRQHEYLLWAAKALAVLENKPVEDVTDSEVHAAFNDFHDEKAEWSEFIPRSVGRMREVLTHFLVGRKNLERTDD